MHIDDRVYPTKRVFPSSGSGITLRQHYAGLAMLSPYMPSHVASTLESRVNWYIREADALITELDRLAQNQL